MQKILFNFLLFFTISSCLFGSQSPKVTHFEWGKIEVGSSVFKDCKLWPGHAEEWNWNKTGTRHHPGIQIADITFIDGVDEVVLSEGVDGILEIMPETIEFLKKNHKVIHKARTIQAVELYNKLAAAGVRVGALLHSTC